MENENVNAKIEEVQQQGWIAEMQDKAKTAMEEAQAFIKFEDGEVKALTFEYDPYQRWETGKNKFDKDCIKMPVIEDGIRRTWEVALSNPVVQDILKNMNTGKKTLKIKRTGMASKTQYSIEE